MMLILRLLIKYAKLRMRDYLKKDFQFMIDVSNSKTVYNLHINV